MGTKKKHPKRQAFSSEQKLAIVTAALLFVGAISFLAGAQAQRVKHESGHTSYDNHARDSHEMYELPAQTPVPTVAIRLLADKGGQSIYVETTNFRFAPEHVGHSYVSGEGHAHLYVDGKKVARIYGSAYYLDTSNLAKGNHEVSVRLATNDHKILTQHGQVIEAVATFTNK